MRRIRPIIAALALATFALASTAQAGSIAPSDLAAKTKLVIQLGAEGSGPNFYNVALMGRVHAPLGCRRHRTVDLYFRRKGKLHLRDEGRSSRKGAVGLTSGNAHSSPKRVVLRVKRKQIGSRQNGVTCLPAQTGFRPD